MASEPPGPDPVEQFQRAVDRVYGRELRNWFYDVADDETLDINNNARHALYRACQHLVDDSLILTVGRMLLFDMAVRGRYAAESIGTTDRAPHVIRRGKPKVLLFFMEDVGDVEPGYSPVRGEISVRIMDETAESITQSRAQTLANRVKSNFAIGEGFLWKKGKVMCAYSDWEKGYQLQLLCRDKSEGRRVIEQVLDIQGHAPDWEFMTVAENESPGEAYPIIPRTERILGQTRRLPRRRPIATVRFKYANLFVPGLPAPISLVDRTGTYANPLVS